MLKQIVFLGGFGELGWGRPLRSELISGSHQYVILVATFGASLNGWQCDMERNQRALFKRQS